MKNLNLKGYGVQEMDAKAMETVSGGILRYWFELCLALYPYQKETYSKMYQKGQSPFGNNMHVHM